MTTTVHAVLEAVRARISGHSDIDGFTDENVKVVAQESFDGHHDRSCQVLLAGNPTEPMAKNDIHVKDLRIRVAVYERVNLDRLDRDWAAMVSTYGVMPVVEDIEEAMTGNYLEGILLTMMQPVSQGTLEKGALEDRFGYIKQTIDFECMAEVSRDAPTLLNGNPDNG